MTVFDDSFNRGLWAIKLRELEAIRDVAIRAVEIYRETKPKGAYAEQDPTEGEQS